MSAFLVLVLFKPLDQLIQIDPVEAELTLPVHFRSMFRRSCGIGNTGAWHGLQPACRRRQGTPDVAACHLSRAWALLSSHPLTLQRLVGEQPVARIGNELGEVLGRVGEPDACPTVAFLDLALDLPVLDCLFLRILVHRPK